MRPIPLQTKAAMNPNDFSTNKIYHQRKKFFNTNQHYLTNNAVILDDGSTFA